MSRVVVPSAPATDAQLRSFGGAVTRGAWLVLDATVGLLATWTVVYHFCLVARLPAAAAVLVELLALIGCWWLWRRTTRGRPGLPEPTQGHPEPEPRAELHEATNSSRSQRLLAASAVGCAIAAAAMFAVNGSWPATAALWLAAAVATLCWAARQLMHRGEPAPAAVPATDATPAGTGEAVFVLVLALAMAVGSTILRRPNPDDLYYVNLSQWVVEHGTFPLRDTIFSDLVFPMASWPPTASYDPLVGVVARFAGLDAATVAYVVVPPFAAFLSVLAMWRLLRAWRVRVVALALGLAVTFLLFDGAVGYATPGNLFVTRLWQGKVILLCLLVPLLLTYALKYVEQPARRGGKLVLLAAGAAAVGLSTTAMFLVPILAVAAMSPLAVRRRWREALLGWVALAAYPCASGVVTVAVHGHSADDFGSRQLFRFDPSWFGHEIYLDSAVAFVAVLCVLVAALVMPRHDVGVITAALVLATGVTFIPKVTEVSYDLVGLGPTLWRVSWLVTTALLVGVVASAFSQRSGVGTTALSYVVPAVLVVTMVGFGTPIWSAEAGVSLKLPWEWQRGDNSLNAAKQVLSASEAGDVVLAPEDLSVTLDVMTTRVKTVAPRDYFMDYLRDEPGFDFEDRLVLVDFANLAEGEDFDRGRVEAALERLQVDSVCLPKEASDRVLFLQHSGYIPGVATASYVCLDLLAS